MQRATCNTYIAKRKAQTNVRHPQEGYLQMMLDVNQSAKRKAQCTNRKLQTARAQVRARGRVRKSVIARREAYAPTSVAFHMQIAPRIICEGSTRHKTQSAEQEASREKCKVQSSSAKRTLPAIRTRHERPHTIKGDLKLKSVRVAKMTQNRNLNGAHTRNKICNVFGQMQVQKKTLAKAEAQHP